MANSSFQISFLISLIINSNVNFNSLKNDIKIPFFHNCPFSYTEQVRLGLLFEMPLWVDKFRPNSLSQLDFHTEQADQLSNLARSTEFPHMLVYGPSGAGKKTRVMALLKEIYGSGAEKVQNASLNSQTKPVSKTAFKQLKNY